MSEMCANKNSGFSTPLNSRSGVVLHLNIYYLTRETEKKVIVLKRVGWLELLLTEMCGKSPSDFCGSSVKFCIFFYLHASAFRSLAKFQS